MTIRIQAQPQVSLGARIRERRRSLGMSQTALAKALGLDPRSGQSQISRWEKGTVPQGETLMRLPALLECDGHWLLTGEGRPQRNPAVEAQLEEIRSVLNRGGIEPLQSTPTPLESTPTALESSPRRPPTTEDPATVGFSKDDPETNRRIGVRSLVATAINAVLTEDLLDDVKGLGLHVEGIRKASGSAGVDADDPECKCWDKVATALGERDAAALAESLLELGERVNMLGQLHGAREILEAAYDVALTCEAWPVAGEAARFLGMVYRRLAIWEESARWYAVAQELGRVREDGRLAALALAGLGETLRERGNLPGAMEAHTEALRIGVEIGDGDSQGLAHHGLMEDHQLSGNRSRAIQHGWAAVHAYPQETDRLRALTSLAWSLLQVEDLAAAEDAYSIVAHSSEDVLYRVCALDGLAFVEALRGNRAGFEEGLRAVDATPWRERSQFLASQFLYFRGKGYGILGDAAAAERWLEEAKAVSELLGHSQIYFEAVESLADLRAGGSGSDHEPATPADAATRKAIATIRAELSAMRRDAEPAPLSARRGT